MTDRDKNKVIELGDVFNTIRIANETCSQRRFKDNYELHNKILDLDKTSFKKICEDLGNNVKFLFDIFDKAILDNYGQYIRSGFPENISRKTEIRLYEADEGDAIKNKDYYHLFDGNKYVMGINIERDNRGAVYTRAAIESYSNIIIKDDKEFTYYIKGFASTIIDKNGKVVFGINEPLAEGLMWNLALETINKMENSKEPDVDLLFKERTYLKELIQSVGRLRKLVNSNCESKEYNRHNDALLYDFFVNKRILYTSYIIDNNCGKGTFDKLNQKFERLRFIKGKDILNSCKEIEIDIDILEKQVVDNSLF